MSPLASLRRFRADQDGSMTIFIMFLFCVMILMAAIAVDFTRFETERARLQSTLDRAVLAAADLDQTQDEASVVRDYAAREGMLSYLGPITVQEQTAGGVVTSRSVAATATMRMPTLLLPWLDIDELAVPASTAARESVSNIEIVLVLDVSGSMVANNSPKLDNLKTAANEFVATVLADDPDQRVSVAMVPFNGQVNLGSTLGAKYNLTQRVGSTYGNSAWNFINCADLPSSAYTSASVSRTAALPATAMADTYSGAAGVSRNSDGDATSVSSSYVAWNYTYNGQAYATPNPTNLWCPSQEYSARSTAGNVVRLPSHSITGLQGSINSMVGVGATSINAGMRWGLTLLDPDSRSMYTQLIGAGAIPSAFSGRPLDYGAEGALKVIVLMTDGSNFPEERVYNDLYRSGAAPIYRGNSDSNYSIYHDSRVDRTTSTTLRDSRPFWVPHLGTWQAMPWTGSAPSSSVPYVEGTNRRFDVNNDGVCSNSDDGRGSFNSSTQACWLSGRYVQQTWPQIWTNQRMSWVVHQLYARPMRLSDGTTRSSRESAYNAQMDLFRQQTSVSAMDAQLQSMCDRALANRVVVYGIAYEAPSAGQEAIFDCVDRNPQQYFDAQGLNIRTTFQAIAAQINALRLVR